MYSVTSLDLSLLLCREKIEELQKADCRKWEEGIEWMQKEDWKNQNKTTPLAKLWRIPNLTHSFLTVTIPHGAHETTSVKKFGNIEDWPIQNNRTPGKLEYQDIGKNSGRQPKKNTHNIAATTALLLAKATEPTEG